MLLGAKQNAEDFIIQILSQHGEYTAEDLKAIIAQQWHTDISVQGVYRVLRKLYIEGIVVKQRQFYSLRVPWILQISELLDRMEDTYLKEKFLVRYLPETNEEQYKWIFSNLIKLSDFYTQLVLAMIHSVPGSTLYQCYDHPWFTLSQLDQGSYVNGLLLEKTHAQYALISGNSFLDKYTTTQWELFDNLYYHHVKGDHDILEKHPGKYVSVVDPYVLIITLDTHTTKRIEDFYASITSVDQLKTERIMKLCTEKIRAKVVIKRDPEIVERYKKRFYKVFGPEKKPYIPSL
jgi:predicted transcriptional regulator